jgi:hypothetical protein
MGTGCYWYVVLKKAISKHYPKNGHMGTGCYWYVVLKKLSSNPNLKIVTGERVVIRAWY